MFVAKTSRARPLVGVAPPGPRPVHPVLENGGFEEMDEQKQGPRSWMLSLGSQRGGFRFGMTDKQPHSGKQSAVIERTQAPWAWGEGTINQEIDAAPFRGKRIVVHAALRTEVSGRGHEAFLDARIYGERMGAFQPPLARASTAQAPIRDAAWKLYELELPVDAKAQRIVLGVVLTGAGRVFIDDITVEAR